MDAIAVVRFSSVARRLGLACPRRAEIEARAREVGARRVWQALGRAERLAERVEMGLDVPRIPGVFEAPALACVPAGRVTAADGEKVRGLCSHGGAAGLGDLARIAQRKRRDGSERGEWT